MKKVLLVIAMILGIFILLVLLSYYLIMGHLIVNEVPKESDIIIVPEGQVTQERANRAVQLLDKGYSKTNKIIVSPLDAINSEYYYEAGATSDHLINDPAADTTYENAQNTLKLMAKMGLKSAIVTSSDYHMNRTRMIYERVNKDYHFDLTYVAAFYQVDGQLVAWPEAPEYIQDIARNEYWKTIGYWLGLYKFI